MNHSEDYIPLAGCLTRNDRPEIHSVFLGIPDDSQSTYRRGCSQGPRLIRSAYDGRSFNSTTELGVDLADSILDLGDLEPADSWSASAERYRSSIKIAACAMSSFSSARRKPSSIIGSLPCNAIFVKRRAPESP